MTFDKYHVFISYSTKDQAVAESVRNAFQSEHLDCWMDSSCIDTGMTLGAAILRGIRASRSLVIIFSTYSNESPWVIREVHQAFVGRLHIFAFRIDNTPLCDDLEFFLSDRKWFDATGPWCERKTLDFAREVSDQLRATSSVVPVVPRPTSSSNRSGQLGVLTPEYSVEDVLADPRHFAFEQRAAVVQQVAYLLELLQEQPSDREKRADMIDELRSSTWGRFIAGLGDFLRYDGSSHAFCWSPNLLPPESGSTGGVTNPRGQVFALGRMLQHLLLAGFHEVDGQTANHSTTGLREHDRLIPYGLEDVCLRALSPQANDRQASPSELCRDLAWAIRQIAEIPAHDPDSVTVQEALSIVRCDLRQWSLRIFGESAENQFPNCAFKRLQQFALSAYLRGDPPDGSNACRWDQVWPRVSRRAFVKQFFEGTRPATRSWDSDPSSPLLGLSHGKLAFRDQLTFSYLVASEVFDKICVGVHEPLLPRQFFGPIHAYLAAVIRSPTPEYAGRAARVLEQLRNWLDDDKMPSRVRDFAAFQLGVSRNITSLDLLCRAVANDLNEFVVVYSAMSLGRLGDPRALASLKGRMQRERSNRNSLGLCAVLQEAIEFICSTTATSYNPYALL
jgi:hypothetical protein